MVDGTVGGVPFAAKDAISHPTGPQNSLFDGPSTYVVMTDYPGACAAAVADEKDLGANIIFDLASIDATGAASAATTTGTYVVVKGSPMTAGLAVVVGWASSTAQQASVGTSGSLVVTALGAAGISGTFDLTFDDGSHVTGSVDAPSCAGYSSP